MLIDEKAVAKKMIEVAEKENVSIEDYWTNSLMDILEDLFSVETKIMDQIKIIQSNRF